MAARLHGHAGFLHRAQRLHIDLRGRKERFSQRGPQLFIIRVQGFLRHLEHPAHQGKAVAVNAGAGKTDQYVAGLQIRSRDHLLLIHDPYREAGKIVLVLRIKAGHLRRLPADQGGSRLSAAVRHALYDRSDLLRIIFPAGDVIQEKQRFSARAGNVVDAHRHAVDPHGIMPVHQERQLQLRSHAVRSGNQGGLFHIFKALHGKGSRKTTQPSQDLGTHGLLHVLLHQLNRSVTGFNIHSGILIIHFSTVPFVYSA